MTASARYPNGRGEKSRSVEARAAARSKMVDQGYSTPCRVTTLRKASSGYAQITVRIGVGEFKLVSLQKAVWEFHNGPLPAGEQVDHLCCDPRWCEGGPTCPHRACCEPSHLEAKTARENQRRSNSFCGINARKTHCIHGHPLSGTNLYVHPKTGKRGCNACYRRRARERRERMRTLIRVDADTLAV